MNELDTREAVRGLADIVKALVVQNEQISRNLYALAEALEKIHPGAKRTYREEMDATESTLLENRLLVNIDALRQQLVKQ